MPRQWKLAWLSAMAVQLMFVQQEPEQGAKEVEISTPEQARQVQSSTEFVTVDLQDRETLAALAQQVPDLKHLELIYYPNGALPEGSIAELRKFADLRSLVLRGDPTVTADEISAIGKVVSLRKLHMALP